MSRKKVVPNAKKFGNDVMTFVSEISHEIVTLYSMVLYGRLSDGRKRRREQMSFKGGIQKVEIDEEKKNGEIIPNGMTSYRGVYSRRNNLPEFIPDEITSPPYLVF